MKPGFKTGSFWLTAVATALAAVVGSGAMEGSEISQLIATAGMALAAVGYSSYRAFEKGPADGKKPWKTTEFWLTIAACVVGAAMTSGAFPADGTAARIFGGAAALLAGLGYQARASLPPAAK